MRSRLLLRALSGAALLALAFLLPAHSPADAQPLVGTDEVLADRAQQVIRQRCVVCHGCYDAPCQLKLEAYEGFRRGASKELVYNASRLIEDGLTRLFDDGHSERDWREKGFYPVTAPNNPEQGVMYRMLELKRDNPLPAHGPLPEGFDFSLVLC